MFNVPVCFSCKDNCVCVCVCVCGPPVRDVRLLILEHCRWSVIQKYQVLADGLTVDHLMDFVMGLKAELYAEGLVQGNVTSVVRHTRAQKHHTH